MQEFGIVLKFWPLNHDTLSLELADLAPLMTDRTRLVCVTHVSNILGQVNPVADIARFVHERGARICVDAVAYAPHRAIDVQAWDVDYYVFSLYKTYGPHYAVMYGKYDHLLELDTLYHYFYGKDKVPGKLEPGNPSYECAYSTLAIRDYFAGLGIGAKAGLRALRSKRAFAAVTAQEDALVGPAAVLPDRRATTAACSAQPATTDRAASRPLPSASTAGIPARWPKRWMRTRSPFATAISTRAVWSRISGQTGDGGLLRVSMVHYNTLDEVDRLLRRPRHASCGRRPDDVRSGCPERHGRDRRGCHPLRHRHPRRADRHAGRSVCRPGGKRSTPPGFTSCPAASTAMCISPSPRATASSWRTISKAAPARRCSAATPPSCPSACNRRARPCARR